VHPSPMAAAFTQAQVRPEVHAGGIGLQAYASGAPKPECLTSQYVVFCMHFRVDPHAKQGAGAASTPFHMPPLHVRILQNEH
jgi:hypothetical protein